MNDRSQRIGVLVVDVSREFLSAAGSWIAAQPELTLLGTARDGRSAVDAVERLAPDLVIIDAFMPVMDGFAATRLLKTRRAAPWVVMVSVHEGQAIEHEAWAAGADAFVVKSNLATQMPSVIESLRHGSVPDPSPSGSKLNQCPRGDPDLPLD